MRFLLKSFNSVLLKIFYLYGDKYERIKFYLLTLSFSMIMASYTIAKELKDSIFVNIVGKNYLPKAKLIVIFLLIPAILFYSFLVDRMRRYKLLSFYCLLYGFVLLLFAFLLGHKTIGLSNPETSPYRLFGWIFFFFLEGFSPFVLGVFWAFVNSVSNPEEAKNNYAFMAAGSKVGGMAAAFFAWYLLSNINFLSKINCVTTEVFAHQFLLYLVGVILLFVPLVLYFLIKTVPGRYLHGYEAVYKLEKEKSKKEEAPTGMFSGLKFIVTQPYILGIFGLIFFYEVVSVVLAFQRIVLLQKVAVSMAGFTASMFKQRFFMHLAAFILSFFGVRFLLKRFGERFCLLLIPVLITLILAFFFLTYSAESILYVFMALNVINYSFTKPITESLYIPTMKDIKFKAKSWIDTFGMKISKGFGAAFIDLSQYISNFSQVLFHSFITIFFITLIVFWFITAYLLGKRYKKAIDKNEIIGE